MTEYYTRDQIDEMASILGDRIKESAEQAQRLPFIQWSSGRFYMETTTGTRWVADSDDNYGANYYQFAEPSGNNRATPIVMGTPRSASYTGANGDRADYESPS